MNGIAATRWSRRERPPAARNEAGRKSSATPVTSSTANDVTPHQWTNRWGSSYRRTIFTALVITPTLPELLLLAHVPATCEDEHQPHPDRRSSGQTGRGRTHRLAPGPGDGRRPGALGETVHG